MFLTFFPRPCPRLLLQMTGDQGAVLLCVQRNMNAFVTPPAPAQVLKRSEGEKLRGRLQFASGHLYSDGVPGIGCILCQST